MRDEISIPLIVLEWSEWVPWNDLKGDARKGGVGLPSKPGVYEVKYKTSEDRLTIGKASNLRSRVKQGLVKGKLPHSACERIRAAEDVRRLVVRWATTNRPAAADEELHKQYERWFGGLPKFVEHT